jgi:hypothetical protein
MGFPTSSAVLFYKFFALRLLLMGGPLAAVLRFGFLFEKAPGLFQIARPLRGLGG